MASLTQIQELLTLHKITDENIVKDFLGLAGKRSAAQNRPANLFKDGIEYHYCRNTSRYFLFEHMTKGKDGKSKGNSNIGNSIYSQAQRYKKNLSTTIEALKDEIIALDYKSKTYQKDRAELEGKMVTSQALIDDGLFADGAWMVDTFLPKLSEERQALFNEISFTKEELEGTSVKAKPVSNKPKRPTK